MLYDDKRIKELNTIKHFHDSDEDYINYEDKILNKTISPRIFLNNTMDGFLNRMNKMISLFFDNSNIIKNWRNYTVDKDYYKHKK